MRTHCSKIDNGYLYPIVFSTTPLAYTKSLPLKIYRLIYSWYFVKIMLLNLVEILY